jgi:hypothetical protein
VFSNEIFDCDQTIDINNLVSIKSQLDKEVGLNKIDISGNIFLEDTKKYVFKSFFDFCIKSQIRKLDLNGLSSKRLHVLFNLLWHTYYFSFEPELIEHLQNIVKIKRDMGEYIDNLLITIHEALIMDRDIVSAKHIENDNPRISFSPTMPINIGSNMNRSILKSNSLTNNLQRVPFDFPRGGYLVIIASPVCSASNRFMSWLNEQNELKSILKSNALFITPSDSSFYITEMKKLNKKVSPITINYSYKENEWPEIKLWETPTFYFYYNGKLKSQLVGWVEVSSSNKLLSELKSINLFPH